MKFPWANAHDAFPIPDLRGELPPLSNLHDRWLVAGLHAAGNGRCRAEFLAVFLQREREFLILGYVILENHLHLIARAPDLAHAMKDFKSFTARQIVDLLERRAASVLLKQLHFHKLPHTTESEYQVWHEGSHPQKIDGDEMMWQKLEYMHNNPVNRGYVDDPLHWRYSSARNYAGQPGLIDVVTDWR